MESMPSYPEDMTEFRVKETLRVGVTSGNARSMPNSYLQAKSGESFADGMPLF